ncbi:ROK family transcriptional regulator [Mesorhizobium sp. BAC0120]|uniref:ROK family transcriptional regulator n=1 Tax=Mesorhizobium sp. BAC0120 TaxID=3090670 RepID=UPI00298D429B|nr:ROK family transcriptional regulator [Mesorhizobium sp. BAC0120]
MLSERGALSGTQIAKILGLAKSTVSMTLAELRKAGMVVDGAAPVANRSSGAGRPATAVMLNPEAGTVVGLLIGLEHIQLIVADVSHAVLADKKVELEVDFSPDAAMAIVQRLVREAYEELGISTDTMLGVGVAIGGPVNPTNGRLMRAGAIPTWEGVDVYSLFEAALERPIYADNVSKCWAIAEMMWGAAHGIEDFVYMLVDLGVAGAIVSRGHLIDGVAGAAGEFGHMTIDPQGDLCRCGNRGCLELYAGFKAATTMASKRFGRPMGIMDVIALARKGDVGCRRLIEDTAEMAGRGLAMVGAAVNPGLILIGGRLAMAGSMFFDPLEASFDKYSLVKRHDVAPEARTRIVPAKMLENGACMGAVGLVLRHYGRR